MRTFFTPRILSTLLCLLLSSTACNDSSNAVISAPAGPAKIQQEDLLTLQGVDLSEQEFTGTPTDWTAYTSNSPELKTAIQAYETNDKATCATALGSYFHKDNFANQDELQGYIVAAYGEIGHYENAIREILKRDRRRQVWNYAVKFDLAICLRKYALINGFEQAVTLVGQLQKEFGEKLASVALIGIPRPVMSQLQMGIHSQTWIDYEKYENPFQNEIPGILEQYPDDPFIDHLYYYQGQPEKALAVNPGSLLRDVLLYQAGYEKLRIIWDMEHTEELKLQGYTPDYFVGYPIFSDMLKYVSIEGPITELMEEAIAFFEAYTKEFPNRPHADDAAYWIAWMYAQMGRYDDTIQWLKQVAVLGNKDYEEFYEFSESLEVTITPRLNEAQLRVLLTPNDNRSSLQTESVVVNLVEQLSYPEAIKLLDEPEYKEYELEGLIHLCKKEFREMNFDQARQAADLALAKGAGGNVDLDLLKTHIDHIKEIPSGDPLVYTKVASGLKNYFNDYEDAFTFIDRSIAQLGQQKDLSTLLYLKVLMLRNSNPYAVEAVVKDLMKRYPQSEKTDDALAELIYINAMVLREIENAESYLDLLMQNHPKGNARDNGMNWVALGYKRCCQEHCGNMEKTTACDKARSYYKRIQREFPLTRFAGYAAQNLMSL